MYQGLEKPLTHILGGGIHKDSSGKLWSIYLAEADEQDEEVTELWRREADSILVFVSVNIPFHVYLYRPSKAILKTGLFSSVIATFLSLSYYGLFPDSTDTTNALLAQISQQLVDISNGVSSQNDVTFSSEPFTPSASAIRVNVIWFLSFAISIASALNATLFQQWSRRYLELTRRRVAPRKCARTRAYMFDGIASFKMSRAVKAMPMLPYPFSSLVSSTFFGTPTLPSDTEFSALFRCSPSLIWR